MTSYVYLSLKQYLRVRMRDAITRLNFPSGVYPKPLSEDDDALAPFGRPVGAPTCRHLESPSKGAIGA